MDIEVGDILEMEYDKDMRTSPTERKRFRVVDIHTHKTEFGVRQTISVTYEQKRKPGMISMKDGEVEDYKPTLKQGSRQIHELKKVGSMNKVE